MANRLIDDWQDVLVEVNERVNPLGYEIKVEENEDENYDINIYTKDGELVSDFVTNDFEDELADDLKDAKSYVLDKIDDDLQAAKVSWLLQSHYNLFHADMIQRAMTDTTISLKDFITGCVAIHTSERDTDDDEFTPTEFKNV